MRLYNVYGKLVSKNVSKYLINWDGKSRSQLQFRAKQFLKPYWAAFQVYEEFPIFSTLLKLDLYNASLKIGLEIDGKQHTHFSKHFHNNSPANFLASIKRDFKKVEWADKNQIKLISINYNEVELLSRDFFKEKFDISL